MYKTAQDIKPAFKDVISGKLGDDYVTYYEPSSHLVNLAHCSSEPEITAVII